MTAGIPSGLASKGSQAGEWGVWISVRSYDG